MIKINVLEDCVEIVTRLLNHDTKQKIIDSLKEYEADYDITNSYIIVKRPTYKILLKLCRIADVVLI